MEVGLFRKLNAIGMLLVCAVLAMGFYSQFTQAELPCPLCLLQRVATVAECGPIECPSDPTSYWLFK